MDIKDLNISPELREKAKACTSPEELLALAKSEGYKLSDEDIAAVSGGGGWAGSGESCPTNDGRFGSRQNIDPAQAHADFVNGVVDGGELD